LLMTKMFLSFGIEAFNLDTFLLTTKFLTILYLAAPIRVKRMSLTWRVTLTMPA
jgi:hypothetical protein